MNFRISLLLVFFVLMGFQSISSQNSNDSSFSKVDSMIGLPDDYGSTLDHLLHLWALQQMDTTECSSGEPPLPVSDSIYKHRLSQIPCLIELPYNSTVRSFIELYTVRKRTQMEYMLGISNYYFPIFEQALDANKLPLELKFLPIIESALHPTAISRVGAAGLWQFMISTGRMYGLEINTLVDERLDPRKASNAAAQFLKDLYAIYGDWNLVIAAYNCGPGNVNKAIRRAGGKTDYWAIYPYLPLETSGYVPIYIAATYTFHYFQDHNLCPAIVKIPALTDTFLIKQRIHLEQISAVLNIPIEELRWLNPQYKRDIIPGDLKPYTLTLPVNYSSFFMQKLNEIACYKADELINNRRSEIESFKSTSSVKLGSSKNVTYHKVKKGETLGGIAAKYHVTVTDLKKWNNIKGSKIKIGQHLKIIR
jgi:membrane-bound lytic murein transglycosylase D